DERLHDLSAVRVRLADDGALGDGFVLEQRALDLERPDPVGRGEDDVVGAAGEPEVAVVVTRRAVAGDVPVAAEDGIRLPGRAVVAGEEARRPAAQRAVALLVGPQLVSGLVDYRVVVSRGGKTL